MMKTVNGDELWLRGYDAENEGKLRSAFRLFLAAAKAGSDNGESHLAYCYDVGIGVKANRAKALYWYRRAYRHGVAHAANNIGTMFRDEHNVPRALEWFQRAVDMGFESSHLEIAKLYLTQGNTHGENANQAILHLKRVLRSKHCIEPEKKEARQLLKQVGKVHPNRLT
jgi:TPR repeat protein